ncbi:outer membrane beta-barrel protein [Solimonas marina]|uniref:Porin family protein n=1 Tax=Solimonas marina TaxID=2714601 RepID=A0A970B4T5_9GAMM|nr:outer membrane beta-barrel protein [Solimonas marina]NKF22657.1 porin family protein [Solimonas marina]
MLKPSIMALLAGVSLLPCVSQAAGPYFGVSGTYADRSAYSDVDSAWGGKAVVGYRFAPIPIFLEASWIDTGKADIDDTGIGATLRFTGYTLGAGYFWQVTPTGSGFWLRGAYYDGDSKVAAPGYGSIKTSANGGSVGLGVQLKFNDYVGLRFEYETLFETKDFASDEDVDIASIGLVFEFPTKRSAAPARAAAPTSWQTTPMAAPATAAMPPPSPPPPAAPLKTQPRVASQTELVIPAGEVPSQGTAFSNREGDWRFVEYQGQTGWVLIRPAR